MTNKATCSPIRAESRVYFTQLGRNISVLRRGSELTQCEVGIGINASQQTIYAIELGDRRVSVPMLVKLAEFFDVTLEELATMRKSVGVRWDGVRRRQRLGGLLQPLCSLDRDVPSMEWYGR